MNLVEREKARCQCNITTDKNTFGQSLDPQLKLRSNPESQIIVLQNSIQAYVKAFIVVIFTACLLDTVS